MIASIQFISANGINSVLLNESDATSYPVYKFEWNYATDGADIPKGQTYGQWPTRKFVRKMPITCEGDIIGTTSAAYWTARKALLAAIVPNPTSTFTNHGRLYMTLEGDGSTYYADVSLVGFQVPMEANYPTMSQFQFQWEANFGYWINLSTGQPALI